jgi:hypothetical protein
MSKSFQDDTNSIIERCKKNIAGWFSYFSPNITEFRMSKAFSFGNQWDENVLFNYQQAKKPTLVFDLTDPYIKKMIGEQRRGEMYPNIVPKSTEVSQNQVDLLCEIIKNITYNSNAKEQFSRAYETMLRGGFSVIQIYTDYKNDKSFEQEIFIREKENPLSVFFDPISNNPDFSDGNWCGDYELMEKDEFKALYPNVDYTPGFSLMPAMAPYYLPSLSTETAILINYYERQIKSKTLIELTNGMDFKKSCFSEEVEKLKIEYYEEYENKGMKLDEIPELYESNRRKTKISMIKAYKLTNETILSETEWPSQYLPYLFLCADSMTDENGRLLIRSLISKIRDAQRLYNFSMSEIANSLITSRRTQLIMTPDQIKGHENMYKNISNVTGALLYNIDPKTPEKPSALPNQEVSQSFFTASQIASQDITKILGMLDPITGELPDGTSGVALKRTITQQNLVVVNYIQNLERIIEKVGKIVLDLLPHIYDTERTMIIKEKGEMKEVKLNAFQEGKIENDIKTLTDLVGEFTIEGTASYQIQAQDSLDFLLRIMQAYPPSAPLLIDLIGKQIDIPLASEIEKRLKYAVPEYVLNNQSAPPTPPNPEIQLKQQELQLKSAHLSSQAQNDKISMILEHIQARQDLEKSKLDNLTKLITEKMKTTAEIHKANLEALSDKNIQKNS